MMISEEGLNANWISHTASTWLTYRHVLFMSVERMGVPIGIIIHSPSPSPNVRENIHIQTVSVPTHKEELLPV